MKASGFIVCVVFTTFEYVLNDLQSSCFDLSFKYSIYPLSTPYGNLSAGTYKQIPEVDNLQDCVEACCEDSLCNVAFLHNSACFSLECRNDKLCRPFKRKGMKYENTFMAIVRMSAENFALETDFTKHKNGFPQTAYTNSIDNEGTNSDDFTYTPPKHCLYGLVTQCPEHETCKTKNNRARSGICHCEDGYERNSQGQCIQTQKAVTLPTLNQAVSITQNTDVHSVSTTAAPVHQLVVSAGDNVTLHLPENFVTLSAYALKQPEAGNESFKYEWTLVSHPEGDETGTMQDQNTQSLKLSKLQAGLYTFKVTVTSETGKGEAMVNVTVLPPERPNTPPVAIIQPSNVTIKLPNKDTVLDGSFSTDDDKIEKFQWEVLEVPIGYSIQLNDTPTLQLKNLIPGLYRFKLNVTDSKGAWNHTFANVTVQKETDYPPTANAKSEVVIYLPQNEVTLNGNMSTDDKGIKSWEWKKSPDTDKAVDMEGTNGPYLHLSQLEVGVYKFILKVTDTTDQTSTTEVHLFVKPESNTAPVAHVGPDEKLNLPLEAPLVLNGSGSTDDIKIVQWKWEQIAGPKPASINKANESSSEVTGLIPGYYQFKLTVFDEKNAQSSAISNITIIQTQNMPPRAIAGGDKTIYLPLDIVTINGSLSSDDAAIVKYQWTRDPSSLAAGSVLENSDQTAVLKLTGLISGRYLFRLTVVDVQGASSSDTASLIVKPAPNIMDQVEIMINADIKSFTQEQQDTLLRQLEILLHDVESVKVNLIELLSDRHTRRVIIIFTIQKSSNLNGSLLSGVDVVSRLKKKLRTDSSLLDVQVLSVDTVVCQNKCSGHGVCDPYMKHCVCEAFWIQNILKYQFGDKESNCDWSILYVIIVSFMIVVTLAGILWGIMCCLSRMRFSKPKKRHRYTLLDNINEDTKREREKFFPNNKTQRNSLMMSDTESDAIYDSQSFPLTVKTNNLHNGIIKGPRNINA